MRVLLTHELFAPDFAGGGEYVVLETARELMHRGVDVRVLTTGKPEITRHAGIPTTRLPIHRYRMNLAVRAILRHARDADLIQTFNYHACLPSLVAGRILGKPVVCYILALFGEAWKEMRGPLGARVWKRWERFLVTQGYARLVFPSEHTRDQGIALGADPARAVVNWPGIDLASYAPAPEKTHEVLFVGKFEARKGVNELLDVAARLPEVHFRLMGWGSDENQVRAAASSNVELVPFERGAPLRRAFARASVFVLPSHAETFGIAVAEAMASGCAVISTVPIPFEGERVQAGNRDSLAAAIARLWSDRETTRRMGEMNRQLARRFSWDRHATRLLDLYADVLGEGACRREPSVNKEPG